MPFTSATARIAGTKHGGKQTLAPETVLFRALRCLNRAILGKVQVTNQQISASKAIISIMYGTVEIRKRDTSALDEGLALLHGGEAADGTPKLREPRKRDMQDLDAGLALLHDGDDKPHQRSQGCASSTATEGTSDCPISSKSQGDQEPASSGEHAAPQPSPESPAFVIPERFRDLEKWKQEHDAAFPWLRKLQT